LAPHHLRLFALIIDYLFVITLLKLLDQLLLGENWDLRPLTPGGPAISSWWVAGFILLILGKDIIQGRSVGKWLTGLSVAAMPDLTGAPGISRSILRNLTLLILPLDAIFVFIDPHGRRLGDKLAGTVVVVPGQMSNLMRRLIAMAIFFLGFMLASFIVTPWNMRRSAAYQVAHRAAAEHPQVVRAVGEPAEPGNSPKFKLDLNEQGGGNAELVFEVEGPRGMGEARVNLKLVESPRRWELAGVRFIPPGQDQAKGGGVEEPLIKKAPPRP
jgi:uncharacterized RDD family membrane protein YckC